MILLPCILYHQQSDQMLNYLRAANKTFFVTKHKLFRIKKIKNKHVVGRYIVLKFTHTLYNGIGTNNH